MAPPPIRQQKKRKNSKLTVEVLAPKASGAKRVRRQNPKKLSHLPGDLVTTILDRLSSADRIRFGATCKKNLSFVTTGEDVRRYAFRPIDKLPWRAGLDRISRAFFEFELFDPLHRNGQPMYASYIVPYPKLDIGNNGCMSKTKLFASNKGWFTIASSNSRGGLIYLVLFSPLNQVTVKLPVLEHHFRNMDMDCLAATFSSDDPSSPDCVYFVLCRYCPNYGQCSISTLQQHQNSQEDWKTVVFDDWITGDPCVVYHEGCFYTQCSLGNVKAYDVTRGSWKNIPLPRITSLDISILYVNPKFYLLVCEGRLLRAFVAFPQYEYHDFKIEMLRCGLYEFSSSTSTWVERTSLGNNHALFLGLYNSFSVPLPSSSGSFDDDNIGDRMYFQNPSRDKRGDVVYYSFIDGQCHVPKEGSYWSSNVKGKGNCGKQLWIEPLSPSEYA